MIIEADWAHEVGQVRSELGEIDLIYKDFDHIYNRLYDIEDIISDEQRNKIVKSVERVRGIVVKAEDAFRTITKSPKAPNRSPIKHSTPIGDKKREMQRISTDIARLSVRIRNIGQSVDEFENVPATDIAETFEKASEQLRKVFVQFEKLIPESIQRYNNLTEDKSMPVPNEIKSYIDGFGGLPDVDNKNVQKYYKWLQTVLPDKDIKLYRGFATAGEIQDGEEIFPDGLALSFSEDKNTALSFAQDRVEEEPSNYGYVVSVEVPKKRIYFHWKYGGNVGISHPKEKEVLAKLYPDYPFKIERVIKPTEESVLDEGIKDWAKKAVAGIALAAATLGATQAQGKVLVKADKGHHELATKLASIVNKAVGNEYDVQVVQKGKAEQLNIMKDGKVLASVDHIFGKDLQFTQAKIFDKDEANTRGSGGHSPRDMAVMVSQSFEKLATESLDEAKRKKKKLKRLLAPFYGSGNGTNGATIPPFRTNMSNTKLGPSLPGPNGMNAPQYGTLPAGPTAPMVSSIALDWDNCLEENFHLCLVCRGKKSHNGKPCKMCNTEWKSKSITSVEETMIDGGDKDNTTWFQGFDRGWDL